MAVSEVRPATGGAYGRVEELLDAQRCVILDGGIATELGRGSSLQQAVDRARAYVRAAIAAAPGLGSGHGPMGHTLGKVPFDLAR